MGGAIGGYFGMDGICERRVTICQQKHVGPFDLHSAAAATTTATAATATCAGYAAAAVPIRTISGRKYRAVEPAVVLEHHVSENCSFLPLCEMRICLHAAQLTSVIIK